MKKKNTTIGDLAAIVKKGFEETDIKVDKKIENLALMVHKGFQETATKNDLHDLEKKLGRRLDLIEDQLETIEKLILANHKSRIEKLEAEIKYLKDALAV